MTASGFPDRYSRQTLFGAIGQHGQERLRQARVAIVGCGALGSSLAEQLARAGVGYLRLIDRDFVEASNLQRQTLYTEEDARQSLPKAVAAKGHLEHINREVTIEAVIRDVDHRNAEDLLTGVDLLLDGADNFALRLLVNDVAVKHRLPWIYGACVGAYGTMLVIRPGVTPCFRCLFDGPEDGPAETCDTVGVLGPAIQFVTAHQAMEALKLLTGNVDALHGKLLGADLWAGTHQAINVGSFDAFPDCPCCKGGSYDALRGGMGSRTARLCGRDAVQITPPEPRRLDLASLADRLRPLGAVQANPFLIRFTHDDVTLSVFSDGRAIVHGTDDPSRARSLYDRFI